MEKGFEGRSSAREKGPVRDQVEEEILAAERAEEAEAEGRAIPSDEDELVRRLWKKVGQKDSDVLDEAA
jgi:hypothetical protein